MLESNQVSVEITGPAMYLSCCISMFHIEYIQYFHSRLNYGSVSSKSYPLQKMRRWGTFVAFYKLSSHPDTASHSS
ncbi:hypothetical protein V6N11_050141 [Hibiscus sabdariffa]|uniref:Uncharacterized protein n=1 Tax=Hibiscus sabdariffa TaxID=183260 RepID=A0ABR2T9B2_9ROSI